MTQSAGGPAAGWYDDPSGEHDKRYWDGTAWTEHVTPRPGPAVPAPTAPTAPEPTAPERVAPSPAVGGDYFAAPSSGGAGHATTSVGHRPAGTAPPEPPPGSFTPGVVPPPGHSPATASPPPGQGAPPRLHVLQKITPFQNVYRVFWDDDGKPGELVAFVKQKRMALKEQFTVYADESATRPVLHITADRRIDISSAMTVTDAATGQPIGTVRKRGAASLLRSTWELEQYGLPPVTVTERSMAIALLRRLWGFIPYANNVPVPWVFHFDATTGDGRPVFTHTRIWGFRDRYVMEVQDQRLDFRMAVAIGILMDAMQHR